MKIFKSVLISIITLFSLNIFAAHHFETFKIIPILNNGRIKPLDTYARLTLKGIYGKSKLDELNAIDWLAEVLFDHKNAYTRKIFKIKNPDVLKALNLNQNENQTYSYHDVSAALEKNSPLIQEIMAKHQEELPAAQKQILELNYNASIFLDISQSLSLLRPVFIINDLKLSKNLSLPPHKKLSYLELMPRESMIEILSEDIQAKKIRQYNEYEKNILILNMSLRQINQDSISREFRIIPQPFEKSSDHEWMSFWQLLLNGHGTPETRDYFEQWSILQDAYISKDFLTFSKQSQIVYDNSIKMSQGLTEPKKLFWEEIYNRYDFFIKALISYVFSFILMSLSWIFWRKRLGQFSYFSLIIGAAFHAAGLIIRCYIMGRPPVSTLYESIIFVSFISVIMSIVIETYKKTGLGTFIGSVIGLILLFISLGYESDGDSMGMLVAVLNSNFWLATHVVTITIGYGCAFVAALFGHTFLIMKILEKRLHLKKVFFEELIKNMSGVTLFALFFTILGTILGGIWADQSWGRFWGWDPKENGAMLICLWLLWVIHGKMAKIFSINIYAAILSLTGIVVVMAWFGVNLLSVGLHSYGFTESIAFNIILYTTIEIIFVGTSLLIITRAKSSLLRENV